MKNIAHKYFRKVGVIFFGIGQLQKCKYIHCVLDCSYQISKLKHKDISCKRDHKGDFPTKVDETKVTGKLHENSNYLHNLGYNVKWMWYPHKIKYMLMVYKINLVFKHQIMYDYGFSIVYIYLYLATSKTRMNSLFQKCFWHVNLNQPSR